MCNFNKKSCLVSSKKGDIFYKYQGIKLNNFTRAKKNLLTTTPKILIVICNAFDERFGLLYEDMKVKNAASLSNNIMQDMCTSINQ